VHALEGHLIFGSSPGQGTRFCVYLPAADETAFEPEPAARGRQAPVAGHETILIVEDDAGVRGLASRVLSRLGYRVLTAAGRPGALALAREHAGQIDLLLADVIMPEANGPAVARELALEQPGLRVLFMSGYNLQVLRGTLRSGPKAALVRKPFTAEQLSRAVRTALDAPPDEEA
jgi:two-component system, cell cycle sensor histidine kinase and response regulator CckA